MVNRGCVDSTVRSWVQYIQTLVAVAGDKVRTKFQPYVTNLELRVATEKIRQKKMEGKDTNDDESDMEDEEKEVETKDEENRKKTKEITEDE